MAGDDMLFHLKVKVIATGGEAEAAVEALTPRTVLIRIDPNTQWDSEALRHLSVALEIVSKTLPLKSAGN
jgi:hypothetical protein